MGIKNIFKKLKSDGKVDSEGSFSLDKNRQEELGVSLGKDGTLEERNLSSKLREREKLDNKLRQMKKDFAKAKSIKVTQEDIKNLIPENLIVYSVENYAHSSGDYQDVLLSEIAILQKSSIEAFFLQSKLDQNSLNIGHCSVYLDALSFKINESLTDSHSRIPQKTLSLLHSSERVRANHYVDVVVVTKKGNFLNLVTLYDSWSNGLGRKKTHLEEVKILVSSDGNISLYPGILGVQLSSIQFLKKLKEMGFSWKKLLEGDNEIIKNTIKELEL